MRTIANYKVIDVVPPLVKNKLTILKTRLNDLFFESRCWGGLVVKRILKTLSYYEL